MRQSILWAPNPGPQTAFLASDVQEILYGGAAGGGKTDALIAMALRWADHPKHRCLMLRRTRPDIQEVVDRTLELYPQIVPGADWHEKEARWKFPSGAIVQMGYAEHEVDIMRFKSFEYNLICFDELTSFTEKMYTFMFTRNRTKSSDLPPLIRAATNPGDIGHDWVKRRFHIDDKKYPPYIVYKDFLTLESGKVIVLPRQFIPSHIWDNPAMPERDQYMAKLMQMGPDDVAAYLHGEWDRLAGAMFQPLVITNSCDLADPQDYYIVRSVDFGIFDPTCVLWLAYYPKLDIIDVISELYIREATLDDVAKAIREREKVLGVKRPAYSVGSPEMFNTQATSNQSIATMLAAQGVELEKGNKDLVGGWARVRTLQQRGTLRVWPEDRCYGAPNLVKTLPALQRDTGLNKDPNRLRPHQEDHAADTLRYGVMVVYERPESVSKPVPDPDDPNRDNVFDKVMADLAKGRKTQWIPDLGEWNF